MASRILSGACVSCIVLAVDSESTGADSRAQPARRQLLFHRSHSVDRRHRLAVHLRGCPLLQVGAARLARRPAAVVLHHLLRHHHHLLRSLLRPVCGAFPIIALRSE